jgi:hypothetical protein
MKKEKNNMNHLIKMNKKETKLIMKKIDDMIAKKFKTNSIFRYKIIC